MFINVHYYYVLAVVQVESVARACCDFMASHLHPSNCVGIRNFAELHGHRELMSSADDFILDNFLAVSASEEFHEMSANNLSMIVASSYLNVRSEVQYTPLIHSLSHSFYYVSDTCLLC